MNLATDGVQTMTQDAYGLTQAWRQRPRQTAIGRILLNDTTGCLHPAFIEAAQNAQVLACLPNAAMRCSDISVYETRVIPRVLARCLPGLVLHWHSDGYLGTAPVVRALWYLTDVDDERDGPFECILRSQSYGVIRRDWGWTLRDTVSDLPRQRVFTALGKAGTIVLFNPNIIHRATLPRRCSRVAAVFTYT